MSENRISVEVRETTGKGAARKLRATGRIPAVLYGSSRPSTSLSLDPRDLTRVLTKSDRGYNTLIELEASNASDFGKPTVLVKDLQRSPVLGDPLHADLYEIDLTRTVVVEIPIHIVGTPVGVSMNDGILDHALREIEVECLPGAIPEAVDADVSALDIGDSLHVRDLPLPEGVELQSDPDLSVVSVVAPAAEEEPAEAAEAVEGVVPAEDAEGAEEGEPRPEGEGEASESD